MSAVLLILVCGVGALLWFVVLGKPMPRLRSWPILLRFTPLLISSAILVFYFLAERGVLIFLGGESMYGLFAVFLLPLSGVLLLAQLAIVLRILAERGADPQDPAR